MEGAGVDYIPLIPPLMQCLVHLLLCEVIGDFFLYWGHRVQHESDFLWK